MTIGKMCKADLPTNVTQSSQTNKIGSSLQACTWQDYKLSSTQHTLTFLTAEFFYQSPSAEYDGTINQPITGKGLTNQLNLTDQVLIIYFIYLFIYYWIYIPPSRANTSERSAGSRVWYLGPFSGRVFSRALDRPFVIERQVCSLSIKRQVSTTLHDTIAVCVQCTAHSQHCLPASVEARELISNMLGRPGN